MNPDRHFHQTALRGVRPKQRSRPSWPLIRRILVIHFIVILIVLIPFERWIRNVFRKRETKLIEMVALGTPNPGAGVPAPAPAPAPKPEPKPQPPTPEPKPKPKPKPKPTPPKPKPKPKPKKKVQVSKKTVTRQPEPEKPKWEPKKEIKISKKVVTRKDEVVSKPTPAPAPVVKPKFPDANPAEIQNKLKQQLQTVGVSAGSGAGNPGESSANASWYHALIKEEFQRQWKKPTLPGVAALETFVSIRIAPDGGVTYLGLSRSSGNQVMDDSVIQAVRAVRKLSKPLPRGLGNPDYEISINFKLE